MTMTTDQLARALHACAAGIYAAEAGVNLLIANGTFIHRCDFTSRFIEHGTSSGTPVAAIDWGAAVTALNAGELPCSGGQRRILQLAASLADGVPDSLRDTVTGLDDHNAARLIMALRHATGSSHLRFVITFNRNRRVQGSR